MRDNPFYSPRLLIADARDDIYSLNEAVRDFVKHQETLISYFDLEQRLYVHTVQFGKPLSPKLPVLMRKAVGSLRSALDQAVYASAITLGSRRLVSTNFPFADTAQGLEGEIKRRCRDVAPEIVALLRAFQPYQGGNVTLWTLNKLRNIKEHRLLVPSVVAGGLRFNIRAEGELLDAVFASREQNTNWDPMNKKLVFSLSSIPSFFQT
jgi:hypothetical protein